MKRALLLGAGFSYDLGMPLSAEFSSAFFEYLSPPRRSAMSRILKSNQPFGNDHPIDKAAIDEGLAKVRDFEHGDYEAFLSAIESPTIAPGNQPARDSYHYLSAVFYDIVYYLLYLWQKRTFQEFYKKNQSLYGGLRNFISDEPTWIFTLNHDLCIEFLAADFGIPLAFGDQDHVTFPVNNIDPNRIVRFTSSKLADYDLGKAHFLQATGINLVKLHGGLSEFTYRDRTEVLNMFVDPASSEATLADLTTVVEEMGFYNAGKRLGGNKEKIVTNSQGELDVLQAAMRTGGQKYSRTLKIKPGEEKLRLLEQVLAQVDELTVIGYGFRDQHINLRLYNALLLNSKLKVYVVNPASVTVPEPIAAFNYDMRVVTPMAGAPEWLDYVKEEKWNKCTPGIRERST